MLVELRVVILKTKSFALGLVAFEKLFALYGGFIIQKAY